MDDPFGGLTPDPCPQCRSTDNLKFISYKPAGMDIVHFPTPQGGVRRTESTPATVLFECRAHTTLRTVHPPAGWVAPEGWC